MKRMRVIFLATFMATTLIMLNPPLQAGDPQGQMLFQPEDKSKLSQKQKAILKRIEGSEATLESKIVVLSQDFPLVAAKELTIPVPGDKTISISGYGLTVDGSKTKIGWKSDGQSVNLLFTGKSAVGMIHFADQVYSVETLGGGFHVISRIDQAKFKDHDHKE